MPAVSGILDRLRVENRLAIRDALPLGTDRHDGSNRITIVKTLLPLIAALLYLVFPRDLIPDMLIGVGWIDDLIVIYLLWRLYRRMTQTRQAGRPTEETRQTAGDRQEHTTRPDPSEEKDPYTVLGIAPGASREEIKSAYRRLAGQYHPDKVEHLGEEFRELAEIRFKEIQRAYETITSR
jgi:uncharacterized membrane protein YkvA (DUF1232 family)